METQEGSPTANGHISFVEGESRVAEEGKRNEIRSGHPTRLIACSSLLCIYVLGVILRWGIVASLADYHGELPFTLESAMLFQYADAYAEGGEIPGLDERAQYPEGLEVTRKLSLGKGIVAGSVFKVLGSPGSFREFLRRFDAAWFCMGIVAAFLVVREMGGGELGGLMAAAFYAVSLPSVVRSTGVEFSRENFTLPLIFLHWWLIVRGRTREKLLFSSVAAGMLLALAAATWDVTQLYILLIGVFAAFSLLFGKGGHRLLRGFLPGVAFLVVAGVTVPYLREHGFLFSWGMLVWYSLAAAFLSRALCRGRAPVLPKVVFLVLLGSLIMLVIGQTAYPGTYSHFARLLLAKLKYFNVKPLNPAKLSYEARMLWTPALHSATSRFLGRYPISGFGVLFFVGMGPFVLLLRSLFKGNGSDSEKALLFWLVVFFVLYVLFVRMEVFLVFFVCCLIGLGVRYGSSLFRHRKRKTAALSIWSLLVMLGLLAEGKTLGLPQEAYAYYAGKPITRLSFTRIGRVADTGSPYAANRVLVKWLQENTEEDAVVLANFTLEPTIFAYARRAIVLHPKFESKGMRVKVKRYLEALFSKNEKDFHDFCVRYGANYYVLHAGVFAGPRARDWIYSNRYMVDRAERRPEYASLAMRDNPDRLQYFKKITDVARKGDPFGFFYRVFKVVSEEEIAHAARHVQAARRLLGDDPAKADKKSLREAEKELLVAVDLFPGCAEAHSVLATVYLVKGERQEASRQIERCKQILADRGE